MYLLDTSNNSTLLFIKSRNLPASAFLNAPLNTYYRVQLANTVSCLAGESLLLSLYSASIPCSFYNITNDENTFTLGGTPTTIPAGNYNVRTLMSALETAVAGLTCSYNSTTNKMTMSYPSGPALILTTIAQSCGFTSGTTITGTMTAPNVVNIIDDYSLYLRTNLNLTNARDEQGNYSDILERIPIKASGSVVYYESPPNQHKNLLSVKSISEFTISLTYDSGNEYVDLNGCDWEIALLVQTKDRGNDMPNLRADTLITVPFEGDRVPSSQPVEEQQNEPNPEQ
jgi:hypothetical protein